jgi:hypothetical protein
MALKDAYLSLKPPYVGNNLVDFLFGHSFDLWHIPKFPVVGLNTPPYCKMKARITVVAWLIDFGDQRRTLLRSLCYLPMTVGAFRIE